MTISLVPGDVSLAQLEDIWRHNEAIDLDSNVRETIDAAAALVNDAANGNQAVYGVNTGFGKLANVAIDPEKLVTLQRNLVLSHCCGVGEALDAATTRLMLVLKVANHCFILQRDPNLIQALKEAIPTKIISFERKRLATRHLDNLSL